MQVKAYVYTILLCCALIIMYLMMSISYLDSHTIGTLDTHLTNISSNKESDCFSFHCDMHLKNFIDHFSKLYSYSIDFNLYNYYYNDRGQLILISIPHQNKSKLLSILNKHATKFVVKTINKFKKKSEFLKLKSPMVDRKNKFLYLNIPKDSSSVFKALFWGIYKNISKGLGYYLSRGIHRYIAKERRKELSIKKGYREYIGYLRDKSYVKIIVIRDPLQRLLSAYLDKCVKEYMYQNSICRKWKFGGDSSIYNGSYNNYELFNMFMDWLQPQILKDKWKNNELRRHFGYDIYGALKYFLVYFDYILFLNEDHNLINGTKYMLNHAHKGKYNKFYYHWNADWILRNYTNPEDDTEMLTPRTKKYSTVNRYQMYYDKKNIAKAYKLYKREYKYLPFQQPV